MGGRTPGRSHRTTAPWSIGQGGHLMTRQRAPEPVVDGLLTDACPLRTRADGVPVGDPQHGWQALQKAGLRRTLQRFRQPRDIVLIETKF
jgi:hypothetical protein